jgi:DNA-binding response OmpR family regulator
MDKTVTQTNILVVEDDSNIQNMLVDFLTASNFEVRSAFSGTEALLILNRERCDMVLLDLMLPGLSGEEVLTEIRKKANIPVIAVTSKDDKESKLGMFDRGADDYMTKPFDLDELLRRIKAVLRRYGPAEAQADALLKYKDIVLNSETVEVTVSGRPISLTKHEYLILQLLMSNPKKVFSKNNIYTSVWDEEFMGEDNAVNVHISNLRTKLAAVNREEKYIQTVWGIGFKML